MQAFPEIATSARIARGSIASLAFLVLVQVLVASSALASSYRVEAGPDQNFDVTGKIDQTSSSAISAAGVMTGLQGAHGTANFAAAAGPGITRASISAAYSTVNNFPFSPHVQAVATTDMLVSGPPGSVQIDTSINLHVDGTISVTSCGTNSICDITLFLDGPSLRHAEISASTGLDPVHSNFPGLTIDAIPGGRRVHGDVAVPISVMSNTPFQITLALQLGGRGLNAGSYEGDYFAPASQYQLSFSPTGVVLNNIPPGYTVSGDNIANNQWLPPGSVVVSDCNDPQLASLTTVAGSLVVRNLPLCTQVLLPNLISVGGDLIVTGNSAATTVDIGSLTSVGGTLDITGNSATTTVDIGSLTSVAGTLDVEDLSQAHTFDIGAGVISVGDTLIVTTNAQQVAGNTGVQGTDVVMLSSTAAMEVRIPAGAFALPVSFTITRITADPPATGTAADGTPATISPISSFQFAFAVPTLNLDASLSFFIDMTALTAADQATILNFIASGAATIIGKGDAPGATYTAFPLCTGAQTPPANGCASVGLLDANGQPTTGQPATVRFDGVVGHFSRYGIGTVVQRDVTPPVITATVKGTLGNNGWYRSDVSVSWTATDPESPVNSTSGCATSTVTADTAGIPIACTATSGGGTASQAVKIKRDATPPTISGSASPAPNGNGWNNTPVTVSFTCSDATSGIAACTAPQSRGEGGNQSVNGTATDNAGNFANATVAGINVDLTAPVVTVTGVANGANYPLGAVPTAGCTTTDVLSGVKSNATLGVTGGNADGTGTFTASCTGAMDKAGNAGAASVTYQVAGTQPPPAGSTFALAVNQLGIDLRYKALYLVSNFTLGQDSDGIDPLTEPVTLRIANFAVTIPAGSFRKVFGGVLAFAGEIDGASVQLLIAPLGNRHFGFQAAASGIDPGASANPVAVKLAIGNDRGSTSVTATIRK
ncbi:MAG: hypothetical protein U1F15_14200 [Burkholderiales bacterium]